MFTQTERNEARERISWALGIGRIGTGPDAPPLPPRGGRSAVQTGGALPIEAEMAGAQLFEFEYWGRPGLELRTRCFVTVAALTALGHADQLYRHINSALNIGVTPEEIHETLLHAGVYSGLPNWENAVEVAREVFAVRSIPPPGQGANVEPRPPMNHEQRRAARDRVCKALNIGRVGQGPDARPLQALPGGMFSSTSAVKTPIATDIAYINADHGFGEVWGRPGLGIRTRSFITMSVLQVMHETNELQIHVNNALNIGITPEEAYEALAHVGLYGGLSGWHTAALVAGNVFEQHAALHEASANREI